MLDGAIQLEKYCSQPFICGPHIIQTWFIFISRYSLRCHGNIIDMYSTRFSEALCKRIWNPWESAKKQSVTKVAKIYVCVHMCRVVYACMAVYLCALCLASWLNLCICHWPLYPHSNTEHIMFTRLFENIIIYADFVIWISSVLNWNNYVYFSHWIHLAWRWLEDIFSSFFVCFLKITIK